MEISLSSLYWKAHERVNLFHFQGDNYTKSRIKVQESTGLYLSKDKRLITKGESIKSKYLFSIIANCDSNDYYLERQQPKMSRDDLWLVLNYSYINQVKGHRLREGETIRLGKVKFKILEAKITAEKGTPLATSFNDMIRLSSQRVTTLAIGDKNEIDTQEDAKKVSTLDFNTIEFTNRQSMGSNHNDSYLQFTCRICFGDSTQDLLINICNCTGSVKYIHVKCLWKWIISKMSFKRHNYLSLYSYRAISCEICHSEIPEVIMVNNNSLNLYQPYNILSAFFENKKEKYENFLALEYIQSNADNNEEKKTVYIINFYDRVNLTLGRGRKSDVHLVDESIDDFHAELTIEDNSIYINDLDSTYGTHLLIDSNFKLPLSMKQPLGIQIKKLFIGIVLNKKFMWCCGLFNKKKGTNKQEQSKAKSLQPINSFNMVEEYLDAEEDKKKQQLASNQIANLKNVDVYDKEQNTIRAFFNEIEEEDNKSQHKANNNYSSEKRFIPNLKLKMHKDDDKSHIVIHSTLDDLNGEEGTIGSTNRQVLGQGFQGKNHLQKNIPKPQPEVSNRTLILLNSNRPDYTN